MRARDLKLFAITLNYYFLQTMELKKIFTIEIDADICNYFPISHNLFFEWVQ